MRLRRICRLWWGVDRNVSFFGNVIKGISLLFVFKLVDIIISVYDNVCLYIFLNGFMLFIFVYVLMIIFFYCVFRFWRVVK